MKTMVLLLAGTILTSSCVGSFGLFNKLAQWNKTATDSKFLNELIFLVLSPAYAVCGVADFFVLNSIEFWTGDNPVANNVGKTKTVKGSDGLDYAVKTLQDGYEMTNPDGQRFYFLYDKETNSWSMMTEGLEKKLFKFNEDGTIQAYLDNDHEMTVTQDAAGLFQVRQATSMGTYWAMR